MKRFPLTDQALEWLEKNADGDCCFLRGPRENRYEWNFMSMGIKRIWREAGRKA